VELPQVNCDKTTPTRLAKDLARKINISVVKYQFPFAKDMLVQIVCSNAFVTEVILQCHSLEKTLLYYYSRAIFN